MWIELALLCSLPCGTAVLGLGMVLYGLRENVTRRGYFDIDLDGETL